MAIRNFIPPKQGYFPIYNGKVNKFLTLYAVGHPAGHWDLYQNQEGYLYAIARPGTNVASTCFGTKQYLAGLTGRGIRHGYRVVEGAA